ncbi:MAG: ABC transporter substrate-binding protein [Oscillospiraceae bacterium]|nr:ABC transporter substrate-binding protein [Oscillospiraceae bacterium]
MITKATRRLVCCALALLALLLAACGSTAVQTTADASIVGSMEIAYAEQFTVDFYDDGTSLLTIGGTDRYLLLPKGMAAPAHDTDAVILYTPTSRVYLAASSAMDLLLQLDALEQVRLTSTSAANWALPEAAAALEDGSLLYAGKYSAPDFELLLAEETDLAVESTMIYHSPDIKEKLEDLGIPVLVERSSYESHPLGRVEWIKVYGLLLGRREEAARFFDQQLETLASLSQEETTEKTVAFFHINSSGAAVVRKGGDYVSKMIELAGGRYAFAGLGGDDNALSTVNMQMESFYAGAHDADVLIYNSAIGGELTTLDQLLSMSDLLADFKAVQTGSVWCTGQNVFQQSSASAGMITDIHAILTGEADASGSLRFFHRLT